MSAAASTVRISRDKEINVAPDDLIDVLGRRFQLGPQTSGYLYVERIERVELLRCPAGDFESLIVGSWAGRVFDGLREIRWQLHQQDGRYSIWRLREDSAGQELCELRERRYYLRGEVARNASGRQDVRNRVAFHDSTLRETLYWPVPASSSPGQRAWILVHEYLQPKPSHWPKQGAEVLEKLNTPRVIAHQFMALGCDDGEET